MFLGIIEPLDRRTHTMLLMKNLATSSYFLVACTCITVANFCNENWQHPCTAAVSAQIGQASKSQLTAERALFCLFTYEGAFHGGGIPLSLTSFYLNIN